MRQQSSDDALYLMRHSCAHVMAEAIQRLFPGVLLVYGPPLDTGFYYDMYVPEDNPISSDDFERIEAEMKKIIEENRPFTRYETSRRRRAWTSSRPRAASTRSTTPSARSKRAATN